MWVDGAIIARRLHADSDVDYLRLSDAWLHDRNALLLIPHMPERVMGLWELEVQFSLLCAF